MVRLWDSSSVLCHCLSGVCSSEVVFVCSRCNCFCFEYCLCIILYCVCLSLCKYNFRDLDYIIALVFLIWLVWYWKNRLKGIYKDKRSVHQKLLKRKLKHGTTKRLRFSIQTCPDWWFGCRQILSALTFCRQCFYWKLHQYYWCWFCKLNDASFIFFFTCVFFFCN